MSFAHTVTTFCVEEYMALAEQSAAPVELPGKGVLYVDASGDLHYINDGGVDFNLTNTSSKLFQVGDVSVQRGDAVRADNTGQIFLGDASSFALGTHIVGVVDDSVKVTGEFAIVRIDGVLQNAVTGFVPGKPIFLSNNGLTGQTLTQAGQPDFPSADDEVLVYMGLASTTTEIIVNITDHIEQ